MSDLLLSAAAAVLVMTALLAARQPTMSGRIDLALCLTGGAAWCLYRTHYHPIVLLPLVLVAPLLCNRAFHAAFEAPRRPLWLEAATAVTLLTAGGLGYTGPRLVAAARIFDVLTLLLFAELAVTVARGWSGDLVEPRRRLRLALLAAGGLASLAIAIVAVAGRGEAAAIAGAAVALILGLAAAVAGPELLAPITTTAKARPLDDREQQILRRLRRAATTDLLRDPNLTLSRLAHHLDVPEHRLRRVIHLGEDHRHFNAWLAAHRLAMVSEWMDDPARDGDTLLTLATEAGYNSLSAFNRAVRSAEGKTPSALRAARKANRNASAMNTADGSRAATTA